MARFVFCMTLLLAVGLAQVVCSPAAQANICQRNPTACQ